MRGIDIDDDVWRALQKRASAFEDTPNSVLRRILKLDKVGIKSKAGGKRIAKGQLTPQIAFREPILQALRENGGSATTKKVLDRVEQLMANKLTEIDYMRTKSGKTRCRNRAQWERQAMVDEDRLKNDSPRGIWELP